LTNQDSAGRKNYTVLNSLQVNKKSIEVEQLFTMEAACQIRTKRNKFLIPKQHMRLQKAEVIKNLSLQPPKLASTSGSSLILCRVSPDRIRSFIKLHPEFSEEAKAPFALSSHIRRLQLRVQGFVELKQFDKLQDQYSLGEVVSQPP